MMQSVVSTLDNSINRRLVIGLFSLLHRKGVRFRELPCETQTSLIYTIALENRTSLHRRAKPLCYPMFSTIIDDRFVTVSCLMCAWQWELPSTRQIQAIDTLSDDRKLFNAHENQDRFIEPRRHQEEPIDIGSDVSFDSSSFVQSGVYRWTPINL